MKMIMGNALIQAQQAVAAGQQYTLTVENENSQFQQFALYQEIPDIIGPSTNPLSLAWMLGAAAPGNPNNPSQSQFQWEIDYSATTGYIQDQGSEINPRRYTTASNVAVQIENQNQLAVTYMGTFPNGAPAFPSDPTSGKAGLITVAADKLIPTAAQQKSQSVSINVGIAMNSKPTVAVQLIPNILYQFTPKPTYYIISGSFVEGQVIDVAISSDAYKVTFDGVSHRTLKFTENNEFKNA